MPYPVSIIIPHTPSRAEWYTARCLPSVLRQGAAEVITVTAPAGVCGKRNVGMKLAQQPWLFFCDDNVELAADCIATLLSAARKPYHQLAYSAFGMIHPGAPPHTAALHEPGPWDVGRLREGPGTITPMALVRADVAHLWDTSLGAAEGWDYFLTAAARGWVGAYVPQPLYTIHQIDRGVTVGTDQPYWEARVRNKHGLAPSRPRVEPCGS